MILNQANLDGVLSSLLLTISTVYILMMEKDSLVKISSMLGIYTTIARHVLEYAEFIARYSEKKGLCG